MSWDCIEERRDDAYINIVSYQQTTSWEYNRKVKKKAMNKGSSLQVGLWKKWRKRPIKGWNGSLNPTYKWE